MSSMLRFQTVGLKTVLHRLSVSIYAMKMLAKETAVLVCTHRGTDRGYLTEGNCCKFPQGKRIQGNLTGFKESVIFSVVYVLFINRFKLLGFNWIIKLP